MNVVAEMVADKLFRARPRIDPPPPHRTLAFGKRPRGG
jgi:hypothetical protein